MEETKCCACCKQPKSRAEFSKNKNNKDGLEYKCKNCVKEYVHKRLQNPEAAAKRKAGWQERRLRADVQEKARIYKKSEKRKAVSRKYRTSEKGRKNARDYIRQRRNSELLFAIKGRIRNRIYQFLRSRALSKSRSTESIVGCTFEQLLTHLGPRPQADAHIDHICPLSIALSEDEVYKLNHFSNLRWLPATTNLEKLDVWTPEGAQLCEQLLGRAWACEVA